MRSRRASRDRRQNRRYLAAVNAHPLGDNSVLGLFSTSEPAGHGAERQTGAVAECYLGLALSCDGRHFSEPERLVDLGCMAEGRTADYPVDGFLVEGDEVSFFVHRDMPTSYLLNSEGVRAWRAARFLGARRGRRAMA